MYKKAAFQITIGMKRKANVDNTELNSKVKAANKSNQRGNYKCRLCGAVKVKLYLSCILVKEYAHLNHD